MKKQEILNVKITAQSLYYALRNMGVPHDKAMSTIVEKIIALVTDADASFDGDTSDLLLDLLGEE